MTKPLRAAASLNGRRVLVLEDEYFLADDIVRELKKLGAGIVGPVGNLDEASDIIACDDAIDAAVLDINLRNEMVFPLAHTLRARNVPFIFTTGYDKSAIAPEFQDVSVWEKPLDLPAMTHDLAGLIAKSV